MMATGSDGPADFNIRPAQSCIARTLAEACAREHDVTRTQRSLLDEDRGQRATTAIELCFDDQAGAWLVGDWPLRSSISAWSRIFSRELPAGPTFVCADTCRTASRRPTPREPGPDRTARDALAPAVHRACRIC